MKQNKTSPKKSPVTNAPAAAHAAIPGRTMIVHLGAIASLILLAWLVYANSLHAPLLYDNDAIILKDPRVHSTTSVQLHRILTQQYWETRPTGLYRPLTTLSFLFNYAVLGDGASPDGYHWLNLLLHSLNLVLVYALGLAIFDDLPAAWCLAALWGIHPVLTESITNVVGRSDMLAGFAVLAALLCHRCALRAAGVRKAAWLAAIALIVAVGMFSKESTIVVIAVLVLYDLSFEPAMPWKSRVPSYVAVAVPCLIFLGIRAQVLANSPYQSTPFGENPLLGPGFWTSRLTAIKVLGEYFRLWLWPARLSADYSYNQIPLFGWTFSRWEDWKVLLSLVGCLAAVAAAIPAYPRRKPLFFAVFFFFITISPTSNLLLLIGTIMGERFLYLPSLAFALALVYGLREVWQRFPAARQGVKIAVAVLLIALAARTYARNSDYADAQRFWESGVEAAPNSYKSHINAVDGRTIVRAEDLDRSVNDARQALAILNGLPDDANVADAYLDTATFFRGVGEHVAANQLMGKTTAGTTPVDWYRQALEAVLHSERIELARDERYRTENARRGKPGLTSLPSKLYLEMGRTYMRLGDVPQALAAFERGRFLESDPNLLEEAAAAYTLNSDPHKAALALVEALSVDSNRSQIPGKLIDLYSRIDPGGCSVTREGGAPSLNVQCPLVHSDICTASRNVAGTYTRRGQQFEAGEIRRIASQDLGCTASQLQ